MDRVEEVGRSEMRETTFLQSHTSIDETIVVGVFWPRYRRRSVTVSCFTG